MQRRILHEIIGLSVGDTLVKEEAAGIFPRRWAVKAKAFSGHVHANQSTQGKD